MHNPGELSFFLSKTTGPAQLLWNGSITPLSSKFWTSAFPTFCFVMGNHLSGRRIDLCPHFQLYEQLGL